MSWTDFSKATVGAMLFAFLAAPHLLAQSPSGVKVSATAIPRLPDGKPDLEGIWEVRNTADENLEAHSASAGIRAGEGVIVDPPDGQIPYQPWAAAKQKENFAHRATADPVNKCFLPGVPRITYMHDPFQIFQTPRYVAIT